MKRRFRFSPSAQAWLALILLQLVVSARFIPQLGFYHDDWDFLDRFNGPGDVLRLTHDLFAAFAPRPTLSFLFSCLISTGRGEPAVYQTILAVISALEAVLLFNLCRRLTHSRTAAFIAAAAALVYPGRNGNRLWFSNAPQNAALVFMLGSLTLHLDWLRTKRSWRLLAGQALSLLCGLTYESLLFMPLMAAVPRTLAKRPGPGGLLDSARRTCVEFSPYLVTLSLVLLWKTVGLWAMGASDPKEMAASFAWAWVVYREAVYCLFIWPFRAAATNLPPTLLRSGPLDWALFAAWMGALVLGGRGRNPSGRARASLIWAGAGALLAAYFPYALSGAYQPVPTGVMSRVNGAGAWAFGLLVAGLLARLRWRLVATAATLIVLLIANWAVSRQWALSWDVQLSILSRAAQHASEFPKDARVILVDAPLVTPGGVGIFTASWDFSGALHVLLRRRDISGAVLFPETQRMLDQFLLSGTERPRCAFSFSRNLVQCLPAAAAPPAAAPGSPPG